MTSNNFFNFHGPKSVYEIAEAISAKISTDQIAKSQQSFIHGIKNIEQAENDDLAFISNKKYAKFLENSKCSACIVDKNFEDSAISKEIILLKTEDPYFAYSQIIKILYSEKISTSKDQISAKAKIGKNVTIGFNVVIEDEVEIGDNSVIEHNAVIKYGVKIGKNCKIGSQSYLAYSQIGNDVIIHPGVRIGTDGFGFATYKGTHHKILHIGSVVIGDNVEIGANSTIDRGSAKNTIIGAGTIIDNLVQIGHNVEIGKNCIIVSQVGIAGSAKLGDYVVAGGQVGIAGHLSIANFVQIAGKSGVISDIDKEKIIVGGIPAQPIRDWHKQTILLRRMLNDSK